MAVPKTFTGGERLFAEDLNDNFQDLDGRVTAAQASANNASDLAFGTLPAERLPTIPAEKLPTIPADKLGFKIAYGSGSSSNTGFVDVVFPAGLFTAPPSFVVSASSAGAARIASYQNLTKDGVKVATFSGGSTFNLAGFSWIAVGM